MRPESVVNQADIPTCPWYVGTHTSRGAFTALNSATMAAGKLRERIFTLAAELFPREIEKNLQRYRKKNPDYRLPEFDFEAARASRAPGRDDLPQRRIHRALDTARSGAFSAPEGEILTADAFYNPPSVLPDWEQGRGNLSATYAFGTHGVEVEFDEETGEVRILRMVAAHDVGKGSTPRRRRARPTAPSPNTLAMRSSRRTIDSSSSSQGDHSIPPKKGEGSNELD